MKKMMTVVLAFYLITSLVISIAIQAQVKADYIGSEKCKMCHKSDKKGNQFGKWESGPHAKAFATLGTDEAKAVAKKAGISGDPQQAKECLVCHTSNGHNASAGVAASFKLEEGVGCEACHGPGSLYKSASVMKALTAGTQDAAAVAYIKTTAETCKQCHNEKSPTYKPFNYEERWAQIQHMMPK